MRWSDVRIWLIVAAAAGCSDSGRPAPDVSGAHGAAPRRGGIAVVAISVDPATLNPLAAVDLESMWIHQGLLSVPLLRYDAAREVQPRLAERWDTVRIAPDTLQLTFHLRRDVRWHDGVPTTAEDVRFTYERMRDPRAGFPRSDFLVRWSPRVEVLDSFTVQFRLQPHAEFLDFWTWEQILPAHVLRNVPPGALRDHRFGQHPLGNGPFRFVRRRRSQDILFEANPDFPAALGGPPLLDRILFRVIPDATARLTELSTGRVDFTFAAPDQLRRLEGERGIRLIEYPHSAWTQIAWNTRRPVFADARVRRALSLAIDREALVDGVLHGRGVLGRWTATPTHWQYDAEDDSTAPRHNPTDARRLLREAGWWDRDGDGVVEDAAGRPLRFTLLSYQGNSVHAQSMVVIQAQLRRVGVDAQIQQLEETTVLSLVQGEAGRGGERRRDFDALLTNWETGRSSDDSWFLHSRARNQPLAITGYASPRADSLMERLARTVDRRAARPLWREYQRLMVRDAPVTVLYYPVTAAAVAQRLQGVEMVVSSPYTSAARWRIAPVEGSGRRAQ